MEDDLNGRQLQWKQISMEDDIKEALQVAAYLASKSCTELGPAQPQLVQIFYQKSLINKLQMAAIKITITETKSTQLEFDAASDHLILKH